MKNRTQNTNSDNLNDQNAIVTISSSIVELLSGRHIALLSTTTTTIIVKTKAVSRRLWEVVEASNEERCWLDDNFRCPSCQWKLLLKALFGNHEILQSSGSAHDAWDLLLVHKILSVSKIDNTTSVAGVFFFPGQVNNMQNIRTAAALDNLLRVCQYSRPSIPLAFNLTTASLCVKALLYTRVAFVIFNSASGQRPAVENLATLKQISEPCMRLKTYVSEKFRKCC
jgi:hypothetical protein